MVDVSVTVSGLNSEGLGESTHNERPLLIRNALPGEEVTARILRKRKGVRFADGFLTGAAHKDRVASTCAAFPRCGGCSMHHLDYAAQLLLKEGQLRDALAEHAVEPRRWRPAVSAGQLGYRTKARLGVRQLGDQVLVGFRESFSNRVARLPACFTLTPALSRLLVPLGQLIARTSIANRIPQIELAQGDDGVSIIVRHLEALHDQDLGLWREFEREHNLQVVLQSGGYDTLRTLNDEPPADRSYQLHRHGLTMYFQPHQFTQVNQGINQLLIDAALAYLNPANSLKVLDLFCGIGNFSLPLARHGAQVVGLEAAAEAVGKARQNAVANQVDAHFDVADLYSEDACDAVVDRVGDADALVLDPPRSGAGPALSRWLDAFQGRQVVYVSCNPKTFAEDATALQNAGFVLEEVGVFDMFPNTAHIETLGYFAR